MTQLGILCAMEKEYNLLYGHLFNQKKNLNDLFSATTEKDGGKHVLVSKCGIGKVNAAIATKRLIDRGVMNIISVGVAGAAEESLKAGDIVIGNSFCYHDVWCGEPNMPGQVQGNPSVFHSAFGKWIEHISKLKDITLGAIATGDWFVQTKEKVMEIKEYLPKTYNIVALDMESAAIAQVCCKENIPFMSIRVISDNPLLPEQEKQYEGFWDDIAEKSFEKLYQIIK